MAEMGGVLLAWHDPVLEQVCEFPILKGELNIPLIMLIGLGLVLLYTLMSPVSFPLLPS